MKELMRHSNMIKIVNELEEKMDENSHWNSIMFSGWVLGRGIGGNNYIGIAIQVGFFVHY